MKDDDGENVMSGVDVVAEAIRDITRERQFVVINGMRFPPPVPFDESSLVEVARTEAEAVVAHLAAQGKVIVSAYDLSYALDEWCLPADSHLLDDDSMAIYGGLQAALEIEKP